VTHLHAIFSGTTYEIAINTCVSLCNPITDSPTVEAFFLPRAVFTPFVAGEFIGSVERGGPVRCDVVSVAVHGNGTHTECCGHVLGRGYRLAQCCIPPIMLADLITVPLVPTSNGIGAIVKATLPMAKSAHAAALIVRTPNYAGKQQAVYSGNNAPFIQPETMQHIVSLGYEHLLVDIPSVDPEEDNGELVSHRLFWGIQERSQQFTLPPLRPNNTITELIYVPDSVADGLYALWIQPAGFDGDAAPSWPLIAAATLL
jgi:arylformamidase